MHYIVRKAQESDRHNLSKTFAYSFEKDFSALVKDMDRIAKVLEDGILIDHFYVAEQEKAIIGIIACTDCNERAVQLSRRECIKQLGFFWGLIGFSILSAELTRPLDYPNNTGYIEAVGVLQHARGQGIAKALLKEITRNNASYSEFVLDVTDINTSAQKCYADFGFVEFKRTPVKHAKQRGYSSKIAMKYKV